MTIKKIALLPFLLLLPVSACSAQDRPVDREPAVAGQFYPALAGELDRTLNDLFSRAVPHRDLHSVRAIIVPHAGYVFSGEVAASGFNQIDPQKAYDNVFIIGPSHYVGFDGASVYTAGDFAMPSGKVAVNRALGESLMKADPVFSDRTDAQAREHSVEVQIPFLQRVLKKDFRIVPIVIGASTPQTCRKIAAALRPFFNGRNLFVVSSDFSHYPRYEDAVRVDKVTADAIVSNDPAKLLSVLQRNERGEVSNLVTSLCGWPAVLTLMYLTAGTGAAFTPIQYRNSGDAPGADSGRVVGYWAIAVTQKEERQESGFRLGDKDRSALLALARQTIVSYLDHQQIPEADREVLSAPLLTKCGAFVTLNKENALRGCIGRFDASEPLYKVVQEMAVAAATQDPRFPAVRPSEVKDLEVEISVLTPMRRIESIDDFELGKHGIYIRKGGRSGTFLPQVARETGWSKEEFLGHCAQDKAGIGWDGWKDAELYVYEALVFAEK